MLLPPLVEPGPPLAPDEAARTARHVLLPELGELGQRRLAAARVLVLGAGGLGAPALLYLAAAGIGTIAVVDDDDVDLTNLQRQVIHGVDDLGRPKTASAARRMREVAPAVVVHEIRERLTPDNAAALISGWDVVLDGTDNFPTRYLVADTCAALGVPLVWASVLRFDAQLSVFWSRPPAPAPALTLRDLFPQPPAPGSVPSCASAGVLGALCGIVGSMMALEAVKLIAGIGDVLLGRVAVVDALTLRVHDLPLAPRPTPSPSPTPSPRGSARAPESLSVPPREVLGAPARGSSLPTTTGRLVDVREPGEFAVDALGGAVNVPVGVIEQALRTPDPVASLRAAGLPLPNVADTNDDDGAATPASTPPLHLYCVSAARAHRAARVLATLGVSTLVLEPDDVAHLRAKAPTPTGAHP